jgi:hypothetical protein
VVKLQELKKEEKASKRGIKDEDDLGKS